MTGRQRLIAVLLLGASFMLSVDFSILNIALPVVGDAVGLDVDRLSWVSTAFALPAAGLALLFGRLGDVFGRRGMFMAGLAVLAGASLLGGFAGNAVLLLGARALQGVAAAATAPAALSLLITSFPDKRLRARMLGVNGALLSGGFTVGALAGGLLVGGLSWRWAFLVNVPVALVILLLTLFVVPVSRSPGGVRLDVAGAATVTAGLLGVVFGITERSLPALLAGVVLLVAFVSIERRAPVPLVALDLLVRRSVRLGNLAVLTIFSMEAGLIFLMTIYMQEVLHLGPLQTGLVFGVPGLASIAAGVVAGRVIGHRGARPVLLTAMCVQGGFTAPLLLLGHGVVWLWLLIPALFIGFFGHITSVVAATVTATTDVPDADAGLATGLVTVSQRTATALGVPVLGGVMALRGDLLSGIHLALVVDVVITLVVIVVVAVGLRPSDAVR
ncbi:MFS transporter [Pseudonocardia lutea]|uniref:MFS transporter n=1 Tax=Pseudonocardia lutea TaxID=2172015 RepID=A0ABW1I3M6_9PSEU